LLTETLGNPNAVKERIREQLETLTGERPVVRVTPRFEGRTSPAREADCYEVTTLYPFTPPKIAQALAAWLAALPGVYRTCVVTGGALPLDWPTKERRYSFPTLPDQVRALMR
jgi:hypothetical protein